MKEVESGREMLAGGGVVVLIEELSCVCSGEEATLTAMIKVVHGVGASVSSIDIEVDGNTVTPPTPDTSDARLTVYSISVESLGCGGDVDVDVSATVERSITATHMATTSC